VRTTSPQNPGIDRALFALWALFWLLMMLVSFEDHRGHRGVRWWEPLLWEGSSCLFATAWLLLQRRAAAGSAALLAEPWRWFARHAAWLPLVAVSFVVCVYALRHGVYALTSETYEHPGWAYLLFYEGIKLLLFSSLWLGIIFGLESFASWRHERERLLALQKHLAESQLAQLKAQLQPHFLFNALNTISSLMQVDVERADRLLAQLADLLRATLQAGDRDLTPLRTELDLLRLYSLIMQERFAGRVTLDWRIDDDTLDAEVPALLLQPLLENAFKHGVERSTVPVAITVSAARRNHDPGDTLEITVRNGGRLDTTGEAGLGLRNCRQRLAVLYGTAARLDLAEQGDDVVAQVSLPWRVVT
jgi:two-component system, LytTR family, sensor kinase